MRIKKGKARINPPSPLILSERVNSGIRRPYCRAIIFFGCEQTPLLSPPPPKCHGNCSKCRFSRETPYVAMCNVILHKLAEVSVKGNIPWHVGPDSWISHAPPRCFLMFGLVTSLLHVYIELLPLSLVSFIPSWEHARTRKVDSFISKKRKEKEKKRNSKSA